MSGCWFGLFGQRAYLKFGTMSGWRTVTPPPSRIYWACENLPAQTDLPPHPSPSPDPSYLLSTPASHPNQCLTTAWLRSYCIAFSGGGVGALRDMIMSDHHIPALINTWAQERFSHQFHFKCAHYCQRATGEGWNHQQCRKTPEALLRETSHPGNQTYILATHARIPSILCRRRKLLHTQHGNGK